MTDYANGFKDGFAAGLEEGKKMNDKTYTDGFIEGMKKTMPPPYVPKDKCPKCGITISGMMGYVCSSVNCPTFYTVSSYEPKGVIGKNSLYGSSAPGTNGPSGPIDYSMR